MNLAIIPARGGSKRILKKNIRPFQGQPIISYAINAALQSNLFDRIIVSTDDKEIASLSQALGADIPFLRPKKISDDYTSTIAVVEHALNFFIASGFEYKRICCIYPCTPFITSDDLRDSYNLMESHKSESCIPVIEFDSAPQRGFKIKPDGKLDWLYPAYKNERTQDIDRAYHDIGAFYWATQSKWLSGDISDGSAYLFDRNRAVDIDTEEDWKRAETIHKLITLT